MMSESVTGRNKQLQTLGNLLSSVDLADLLLEELVTLLADLYDLGIDMAQCGYRFENLLGDLGSSLILGKSIWVGKSVICYKKNRISTLFKFHFSLNALNIAVVLSPS